MPPLPYNHFVWEIQADPAKVREESRATPEKPQRAKPDEGADQGAQTPDSLEPAPSPEAILESAPDPGQEILPDDLPAFEPRKPEDPAPPETIAIPSPGEKLLVFDLANEKYALPIHDIAQIIDLPPTTPVPSAPEFLAGIFSLRGKIISIIDVGKRLGLENAAPEAPKVIVVDILQDRFGLLVDRIDQVVDVNLATLEPPPEGFRPMAQDFVEGVFHHRGRAVGFLNLPMFLAFEV